MKWNFPILIYYSMTMLCPRIPVAGRKNLYDMYHIPMTRIGMYWHRFMSNRYVKNVCYSNGHL